MTDRKPRAGKRTSPFPVYAADGRDLLHLQCEILNQISDAVVVLDKDQRILCWNRAAEDLSGRWAQDVLGRIADDGGLHFWINFADEAAANAALSRGGEWCGERPLVAPDGRQLYVETTLSVMKDGGGKPVGTIAIVRDVTQRRQDRKQHEITEKRLRGALKVGGMGYLDWDLKTNDILWSDETYRIYGVKQGPKTPTIESTMRMVHPEDFEFVKSHLEAVVKGEAEYNIEHRMIRPDGRVITVHAMGEVTRDDKGNPLRMLGTVLDITERKRVEEERRRSHEFLHKVLASLDEAVLVVDQDTRIIIECNETAERMFGFSRRELLGGTTRMLHVNEEAFEQFLVIMMTSVGTTGCFRTEFRMKRRNGEEFPAEFFIRPIHYDVRSNIFLGVVRDLSERLHAEEERARLQSQLQQAQKMEAIGQLAGGVAHDFNNLLTVINGYASVMQARLSPSDPLHEDVAEILQAGQRAASLTQQLLAFSRKQIVQPRALDLNQIVAEDEHMLQRLIGEQIKLRVNLAAGQVSVLADPGQIQQVIINLMVNARDAVAGGGVVAIETGNVELKENEVASTGWVKPGPFGMLTISDSGAGMDADTKARIFEPFFTTKELGRGTGLGLSTVYGIVQQSNGAIVVESEPGRGTTFKIYLPAAEGTIEEIPAAEIRSEALRGTETILLVEDEREVRKLTYSTLKQYGYRVLEAANAGEAFLICEQAAEPIALMIADVVMPGMTGWQLAQRLNKMRPEMKVIYISGYAHEELTHRGALQDGVHFVQKPFDPQSLVAKVREILTPTKTPPRQRLTRKT